MIDVPETQHRNGERGRLVALGRRTDNDKRCTLLVVNEADGSVTLSQQDPTDSQPLT